MADSTPIPDHELPDELPASFVGSKRMLMHINYGSGGGALYRWVGRDGREWPIQEQYDTRRPKPATAKKQAFTPNKTGVVIIDPAQTDGFYGEVCSTYSELRETWKRWRAEKKPPVATEPAVQEPLQQWPFPVSATDKRGTP